MAHHEVDNFNGYITEMSNLLDTPHLEHTSLWINQYEPTSSPPIVLLLEPPPELELMQLLVIPTATLPVISSQEDQIVGVLDLRRKAVGWDICKMRGNDFIANFSIFGTTFEDCLQNLSFILK